MTASQTHRYEGVMGLESAFALVTSGTLGVSGVGMRDAHVLFESREVRVALLFPTTYLGELLHRSKLFAHGGRPCTEGASKSLVTRQFCVLFHGLRVVKIHLAIKTG